MRRSFVKLNFPHKMTLARHKIKLSQVKMTGEVKQQIEKSKETLT
jgi:hypothetical protein